MKYIISILLLLFSFSIYSQNNSNLRHKSLKSTYTKQSDSTALKENTELVTKSKRSKKKKYATASDEKLNQPIQKDDNNVALKNETIKDTLRLKRKVEFN